VNNNQTVAPPAPRGLRWLPFVAVLGILWAQKRLLADNQRAPSSAAATRLVTKPPWTRTKG